MNGRKSNPFIGKPKDRRQDMFARLTEPAIQNHTPQYHQAAPAMPQRKQLIVVTLDKLRPYEGNPRKTKNPAYEEIKASIKARGLDHAPNITQRPGEDFYTIADGGNTRLQALNELFKETQEPRFWSIECVFKPWEGEANDINSKLNILIGHLAENDIRGELSFIEKALGIREVKALYEEKYKEYFSHRKLSEKLGENGYPISNQLIARMEQCLTYLYPHIPNILLEGLGKPQIEKLLHIHRNAQSAWDKYKDEYSPNSTFDEVWMNVLSGFDEEPTEFAIETFQDSLIGKFSEAFSYEVSYDTLKIDIDLEERKLRRLIEKQPHIAQLATESALRAQVGENAGLQRDNNGETDEKQAISSPQMQKDSLETILDSGILDGITEMMDPLSSDANSPDIPEEPISSDENELNRAIHTHYQELGFVPGVNPEAQRAEEAQVNGLEFANVGKSPVTNLWKIYPKRKHKMDAFTLALEIAQSVGLAHLVQHVVKQPVDYSFNLLPLDITEPTPLVSFVYQFLCACATEEVPISDTELRLSASWLVGSYQEEPAIDDLLLVRLIRLLRVVRYIKEQSRAGE